MMKFDAANKWYLVRDWLSSAKSRHDAAPPISAMLAFVVIIKRRSMLIEAAMPSDDAGRGGPR